MGTYPLNLMAHYRLFYGGRYKYFKTDKDFPYIADQEAITLSVTLIGITVYLFMHYRDFF
jgi:hypothetical protein